MALPSLNWLDAFRAAPPAPGYPDSLRTLYAPVDEVHKALVTLVESATTSLVVAMYGYDDQELADSVKKALANPACYVQLTLDRSQAAGAHEQGILAAEAYPATSIAIGDSERGDIMHLKLAIIDGTDLVTGSTNWSGSAQDAQDNQLTVIRDSVVCAEARARIDAIHANILAQKPRSLLRGEAG